MERRSPGAQARDWVGCQGPHEPKGFRLSQLAARILAMPSGGSSSSSWLKKLFQVNFAPGMIRLYDGDERVEGGTGEQSNHREVWALVFESEPFGAAQI